MLDPAKVARARGVVVAALLCALAPLAGCDDAGPMPPAQDEALERADGEAMFRGVFYGEGAVGEMLPEIWNGRSALERAPNAELAANVRQVQDRAIAKIQDADATFFERFGDGMRSGNHLVIERVLQEGAGQLQEALAADPIYAGIQSNAETADPVVEIETAVYAVLIVVVFFIDFNVMETSQLQAADVDDSTLKRDYVVDLVADRLAVR